VAGPGLVTRGGRPYPGDRGIVPGGQRAGPAAIAPVLPRARRCIAEIEPETGLEHRVGPVRAGLSAPSPCLAHQCGLLGDAATCRSCPK